MYYTYKWLNAHVIRHSEDRDLLFGPFTNQGDAHFVVEMLNTGTLQLRGEVEDGKQDLEESHTVYEYSD